MKRAESVRSRYIQRDDDDGDDNASDVHGCRDKQKRNRRKTDKGTTKL